MDMNSFSAKDFGESIAEYLAAFMKKNPFSYIRNYVSCVFACKEGHTCILAASVFCFLFSSGWKSEISKIDS